MPTDSRQKNMIQVNQLIYQLKRLIEDNDAYGSPIEVLNYSIKSNNDIDGKFKDNWNNRVFSFVVLKDKLGYKPAVNLINSDSAEASARFDIFSKGYLFLDREDGKKIAGKPKCTSISYGCGNSCIQLKKTCWINGAGKKVKTTGGGDSSISQDRIDKLRVLAGELRKQPGGGNWSRHGTADLLEAKAKNLEESKNKKVGIKTYEPKALPRTEQKFEFPPYDIATQSISPEYKEIGSGAFGTIYLDTRDTRQVKVLKYNKRDLDINETIGAAKTMGDLGIGPKIYGSIFEKDKVSAIAMEYLDGYQTLSAKYNGSPLTAEQKNKRDGIISENLLKITKIAHDNGLVHTDIHPQNIMVHPETLDVKFIDIDDRSDIKTITNDDKARNTYKEMARQLLLNNHNRPISGYELAQNAENYANRKLLKDDLGKFKEVQLLVSRSLAYQDVDGNPAAKPGEEGLNNFTEKQYKDKINEAYKLLGV